MKAETTIEIDAPIATVWRVVLDFSRYCEWNPFIVDVEGAPTTLGVGDPFTLVVRWRNGGGAKSKERVVEIAPPAKSAAAKSSAMLTYRFDHWMHRANFIRATRLQTLEQDAGGPTRYRSIETFSGIISCAVPLTKVQHGFEDHAAALKTYAEQLKN